MIDIQSIWLLDNQLTPDLSPQRFVFGHHGFIVMISAVFRCRNLHKGKPRYTIYFHITKQPLPGNSSVLYLLVIGIENCNRTFMGLVLLRSVSWPALRHLRLLYLAPVTKYTARSLQSFNCWRGLAPTVSRIGRPWYSISSFLRTDAIIVSPQLLIWWISVRIFVAAHFRSPRPHYQFLMA